MNMFTKLVTYTTHSYVSHEHTHSFTLTPEHTKTCFSFPFQHAHTCGHTCTLFTRPRPLMAQVFLSDVTSSAFLFLKEPIFSHVALFHFSLGTEPWLLTPLLVCYTSLGHTFEKGSGLVHPFTPLTLISKTLPSIW